MTVNPNGAGNGKPGLPILTKKDFSSDQETRWCPGCGDYAILATVQGLMPELGVPPERTVFVFRDRLRRPLRLLHGHLRSARHSRPRDRTGDGPRNSACRPIDLGRHR